MTELPPDELSTGVVRAAGAVVWRRTDAGDLEVLLVHRPRYDDWSLPKGKLERGEHVTAAAVREVSEETGVPVALGRPLGDQHYTVTTKSGQRAAKVVSYWAAHAPADAAEFEPHSEVDGIAWVPIDDAYARLTWERDGDVLDEFRSAPVDTVPLLVLRHAEAIARAEWDGTDDEKRPLSVRGEAQSAALVPLLAAYDLRRVVSSPSLRCLDTVTPYAAAAGLTVETHYALTERGIGLDAGTAGAVIDDLAAGSAAALVCSHRPVLPQLLTALGTHGELPVKPDPLRKGEFLVAHLADGAVVAAERHAP